MKEELLREIDNLREDIASYQSGNLLLLTSIDHDGVVGRKDVTSSNEGCIDIGNDDEKNVNASKARKPQYAPKSILFRAFSTTLTRISNNDHRRPTMFWKRKKKKNNEIIVEESATGFYDSPSIVV